MNNIQEWLVNNVSDSSLSKDEPDNYQSVGVLWKLIERCALGEDLPNRMNMMYYGFIFSKLIPAVRSKFRNSQTQFNQQLNDIPLSANGAMATLCINTLQYQLQAEIAASELDFDLAGKCLGQAIALLKPLENEGDVEFMQQLLTLYALALEYSCQQNKVNDCLQFTAQILPMLYAPENYGKSSEHLRQHYLERLVHQILLLRDTQAWRSFLFQLHEFTSKSDDKIHQATRLLLLWEEGKISEILHTPLASLPMVMRILLLETAAQKCPEYSQEAADPVKQLFRKVAYYRRLRPLLRTPIKA